MPINVPAFITIPPPIEPGMPAINSIPENELFTANFIKSSFITAASEKIIPFFFPITGSGITSELIRITIPRIPLSPTTRFDPAPITIKGIFSLLQKFTALAAFS